MQAELPAPGTGVKRGPVTVGEAAELLLSHRTLLTADERRIVGDVLADGRCATAGDHARLQGSYARLRLQGLVP